MIVISYQISLLEPVLVTMLDGEPNSKESLNYLPGTALRGAVIAAWMRDNQNIISRKDAAANAQARTLFFNGKTRFLNGYPMQMESDKRSLPTPLSWHTKKGEADAAHETVVVHEFAHPDFIMMDKEVQWSRTNPPFRSHYDGSGNRTQTLKPDLQVMVHTTRSRIKGRATPDEGDLFRYTSLEASQTFKAYVLLDEEASAPEGPNLQQDLVNYLPSISRLGGSRNAGYGRVCVSGVALESNDHSDRWRECDFDLPSATLSTDESPTQAATQATVILLSDALLRNSQGQHSVDRQVMENALAAKLPGAKIKSTTRNNRAAYMEETVIGGFNQKWGLPLVQQQAFAMGSVFLVTLPSVDMSAIATLEDEGIGERRAEGFGRVGVCTLPQKEWQSSKGKIARGYETAPLSSDGKNVLRDMATRMVRAELDRLVLSDVQNLEIQTAPSGSQLSRLRSVIQQKLREVSHAQHQEPGAPVSLDDVAKFLDDMRDRAKDQYQTAKVDDQVLFSWLKDQLKQAERYVERRVNRTQVGGEESALTVDEKLKPIVSQEYALRVIDGVLAKAAKERT